MGKAKLTEMEYTTIKQLLEKGYEGIKVATIVGRGRGVVSLVNTTSSYKEYVERGKAARAKYKTSTKSLKAQQLPLDTPKKTTLDLREELAIKFNSLIDTVETLEVTVKNPKGGVIDLRKGIAFNRAKERLEEARLWLKEAL